MQLTQHAHQRMTQRGITRAMINLVLEYGEVEQDKAVLDKKHTERAISERQTKLRTLKKILDKGGCVVVESDNTVVTAYNYQPKH